MSSEIKIGDTVDCIGNTQNSAKCQRGTVKRGPTERENWVIEGKWTDSMDIHVCRPDQITRHVPAAPVVERPASVGDKLASEMTVRERMIVEGMNLRVTKEWGGGSYQPEEVIEYVDALIAALDKEQR